MYFHSRIGIYRGVIFRDVLNSSYSHSPCGLIFLYISQTSSTAYHTLTPFWVLFKLTARQRALFHISSSLFLCSLKICQSCQSCNLAFTYSRSSTKDPGWPPAELDPYWLRLIRHPFLLPWAARRLLWLWAWLECLVVLAALSLCLLLRLHFWRRKQMVEYEPLYWDGRFPYRL